MTLQNEQEPNQQKKRNGNLFRIAGFLLIIIALFCIGLIFRWKQSERQASRVVNNTAPKVRIMIAEPAKEDITLTLPGFLIAYNVTPVLARTNGYLKNFSVDIGDKVKANQLLCEIETPDIDAKWIQANADLEAAKAKLEIAKITAERWAGLYEADQEAISKQEVDQNSAGYLAALADVNAAQANFDYLKVLKDFKYVQAPFDGIVVERNIDIGSLISEGNESMTQPYTESDETLLQPLFKIANTETIRVFVEVPQPYYPLIQDGVKVQVTVPEYPEKVFEGAVDRNAFALDQVVRTMLTQINIDNKDSLLRPGLYTEVRFSFKPYKNSFNIPVGAIIIRKGPPHAAILKDDDTVQLQQVLIGEDYGKSVQIIKGLKEGDRVIVNPNYRIKEGIKVHIIQ